jgi:hypothetical protein
VLHLLRKLRLLMDCTLKRCVNRPTPETRCEACRKAWREYGLRRRGVLSRLGRCPNDGNACAPKRLTCQRCLDRCTERLHRLRSRNVADSKCMRCAAPVEVNPKTAMPYAKCDACRQLYKELYRKPKARQESPEAAE